jgi:3-oxoadipate enol-lactonase/4-carboxymuconolactone decarboxylase
MPFVALGGHSVHYQLTGPSLAPLLLAIHSLGASQALFEPLTERLESSQRVLRWDLPGHGLSSDGPRGAGVAELARLASALLDALSLERAHVLGVSLGGQIALSLAAAEPARVERLVLAATASRIGTDELWRERSAQVTRGGLESVADSVLERWTSAEFRARRPAEAAGLRAGLLRTSREGYLAGCEALRATDLRAECAKVAAPTLVLAGELDAAVPLASARALCDSIAGARLEIVAGAGHLPVFDSPDAAAARVLEFLTEGERDETLADLFERGLEVRRAVLGASHVERSLAAAGELDREFQAHITRTAWGSIWARPGLDLRARSIATIAMLIALGREEELALHVRASRNTGVTARELAELLLHSSVYAGVPAANAAIRVAKRALSD